MAVDAAKTIKNLNINIPSNREERRFFAEEVRNLKSVIKNCFPNVDGKITYDDRRMNAVFKASLPQVGMIMYFAGRNAPEGWAFCDGRTYFGEQGPTLTPDLRGTFIMGANVEYDKTRPIVDKETGEVNVGDSSYSKRGDSQSTIDSKIKEGSSNYEKDFSQYLKLKGHKVSIDELPAHDHSLEFSLGDKMKSSGGSYRVRSATSRTTKTGEGKEHPHEIIHYGEKYEKPSAWFGLSLIMYIGFPAK